MKCHQAPVQATCHSLGIVKLLRCIGFLFLAAGECAAHGVVVEQIPGVKANVGDLRMMGFWRWARRLSWRETAQVFRQLGSGVSLGGVVCAMGLGHRNCRGWKRWEWMRFIGDGLRAENFLT